MKHYITLCILLFTAINVQAQDIMRPITFSGVFTITELLGENVTERKITLKIDKRTRSIKGNTGCNEYMTDYIQNQNTLQFSYIANTKKPCEHSQIEERYFENLATVNSFVINGKEIVLLRDEEEVLKGISK